jgi:hypothetical protein
MPRNQTALTGVPSTGNQGGAIGQGANRAHTTRRRKGARGARGNGAASAGGGVTSASGMRFAGMSGQQIYDLGLRHGCEISGSKPAR